MRATKRGVGVAGGVVVLALVAGLVTAGEEPHPAMPTNPGFEKLKSLIGDWQGKAPDGTPGTISYKLVSAGSAILESIGGPHHIDSMITVYHPDGARLMMTHYCSAANQPRMVAGPVSAPVHGLHFKFLDVTNLASPDAGYMNDLVVTFVDHDHFDQAWTFTEKGKANTETFHWSRVK